MQNSHLKTNSLILAVETSGRKGSAALGIGKKIFHEIFFSSPIRHGTELFPAVSTMLKQIKRPANHINHIYISAGPGSFTGIRIAVTMAKTLHLANNAKIVAVDTMNVIAENATDFMSEKNKNFDKIATIIDAKRGQFYIAVFSNQAGHWVKQVDGCLMTAEEFKSRFSNKQEPLWLLGEGLLYYSDKFKSDNIHFINQDYWSAKASKLYQIGWQMAEKGNFSDPLTLEPFYLRKPEAEETWALKHPKQQ